MQMQRALELEARKDFASFKEDLDVKIEEERLLSEAPIVPTILPLESVNIESSPYENVSILMR